ncbi:MAG: adenine phosphoribosyltransferase [Acidobacteriota bacterium]
MTLGTRELESLIRDVPDFPKPGIVFKDITPLLRAPEAFETTLTLLGQPFRNRGITAIAAIESRGFIFGACLARELECAFIPIRKPGKLPWTTRRHEYVLEYGSDSLEIHDDALSPADRVVVVDDLLATGGTASAAITLVRGFGSEVVSLAVVIELDFLNGRSRLEPVPVHALLHYS